MATTRLPAGDFLHDVFTSVPPRYDLINRLVTLGLDKRWRGQAARECLVSHPARVLDLCCGTGDLAVEVARLAGDDVAVVGLDYSQPMLDMAARKAEQLGDGRRPSFTCGDVAHLPFPQGYFDCVGISFAFRNLTYANPLAQRYLAETLRVLSDGGRFVIVETSQPGLRLVRQLYHLYLRQFVFRLGYLISGNRKAYRYLAESAARFYTPDELEKTLVAAGFRRVSCRRFLLGAVSIHVAVK